MVVYSCVGGWVGLGEGQDQKSANFKSCEVLEVVLKAKFQDGEFQKGFGIRKRGKQLKNPEKMWRKKRGKFHKILTRPKMGKINELKGEKGTGDWGVSRRIVWRGFRGLKPLKFISDFFPKFEVSTSELLQNNKYINTYKFKFFLNKGVDNYFCGQLL